MELDEAYQNYQMDRSAQNLRPIVEALRPTIDYQLNSLGVGNDPHMRNMATVYTAKAIDKYDPDHGTNLKTWVSHQLQPLKRLKRQTTQVLKVPERIQLDGMRLANATREFEDKHGREPDAGELAEYAKLPIRRIKQVREYDRKVGVDSEEFASPEHTQSSFTEEALDYVYMGADHLDRKILEHRMGYGGGEILPGNKLTSELGITHPQLSRRAARLSKKLLDLESQLEGVA